MGQVKLSSCILVLFSRARTVLLANPRTLDADGNQLRPRVTVITLRSLHLSSWKGTMATVQQQPLNWEASATTTHPQVSSTLPSEVVTCLKNARFVR